MVKYEVHTIDSTENDIKHQYNIHISHVKTVTHVRPLHEKRITICEEKECQKKEKLLNYSRI